MLELVNVRKTRNKSEILRGVSLEIGPGEVISIVGPNGAGKSTLIDIAAGVLLPDSGKVLVNGRDIHADFRAKSLLTTVFQETTFDAMMTPKDALMFHAKMLGIRNARTKIEELMTLLKVDGFQSKRIFELSGGTRRKLEVAKAFISETPVYLLDEPTNGLDRTSREIVWDRIRTLAVKGSAVVIVSHDTREALTLASKTLELNDGVLEPYQKRSADFAVSRLTVSFGRFARDHNSEQLPHSCMAGSYLRTQETLGYARSRDVLRSSGSFDGGVWF